jgi:hypothetical protein
LTIRHELRGAAAAGGLIKVGTIASVRPLCRGMG